MMIARVLLFFRYHDQYSGDDVPCALVNWFVPPNRRWARHADTGMWVVKPELVRGKPPLEVIHLETIARGAHLLPVFGEGFLPENFDYTSALNAFDFYFVNQYADHHSHEFLAGD
jgi:hypothetical protein